MENKSQKDLNEIISRVVSEVNQEVTTNEATFKITDFPDHANTLSNVGGKVAWTISYSTAKSALDRIGDLANPASKVAWTISYSTSKSAIDKISTLDNPGA